MTIGKKRVRSGAGAISYPYAATAYVNHAAERVVVQERNGGLLWCERSDGSGEWLDRRDILAREGAL